MSDWQPAIRRGELSEQGLHAATVGDHKVVVLLADGEIVAYRDACPHEGFPLSKFAERQDFVIMCNKHLWEFDTGTGEHISRIPRPQCNLKRYPTREVDGMVEVDLSAVPLGDPGPITAYG
ncbi:MAG: Rieske (2Fe-2S) protein [Betaproteobacteria bacterium]|nr:Rieske (2Fe-2S) protein [Betaproteobacteria bacterium]